MAFTAVALADITKDESFGRDNRGRTIKTRSFLVKVTGTGSVTAKLVAVLSATGIPKYGDYLWPDDGSHVIPPPTPAGYTNPMANTFTAKLERDDDPYVYIVGVEYGYNDPTGANQYDDTGDEPDVDRERYPWENNADVTLDLGNGRESVPEGGVYCGCLTLQQVINERGTADALDFLGATFRPLNNTAGDPFKDPPTKIMRSGTINISFSRLNSTGWKINEFLRLYLFKINELPFTIGQPGDGSLTGSFTVPAGTCQVVGFSCTNKTLTETRKWRPGMPHPFGKKKVLTVLMNTSKTELTATRYTPYYDITLKMEYREDGYLAYIQNMGMRSLETVYPPSVYSAGVLSDSNPQPYIQLLPIRGPDTEPITEPWKLKPDGSIVPFDSGDVYFLKYKYYDYANFATFIALIPWVPDPVVDPDPPVVP